MANRNMLLGNLDELAGIEKKLWESFVLTEKKFKVGVFNLKKQFCIMRKIKGRCGPIAIYYPFFQLFVLIFGFLFVVLPEQFKVYMFFLYALSLPAPIFYRDNFILSYHQYETGYDKVMDRAFGIDGVSMKICKSFEHYKSFGEVKLNKLNLDSIIKLVKSQQEYESANFGYYDHFHKLFIAGIYSLPFVIWNYYARYQIEINKHYGSIMKVLEKNWLLEVFVLSVVVLFLFCILYLFYSFAYGDKALRKKKKEYLLFLNVLRESYV